MYVAVLENIKDIINIMLMWINQHELIIIPRKTDLSVTL